MYCHKITQVRRSISGKNKLKKEFHITRIHTSHHVASRSLRLLLISFLPKHGTRVESQDERWDASINRLITAALASLPGYFLYIFYHMNFHLSPCTYSTIPTTSMYASRASVSAANPPYHTTPPHTQSHLRHFIYLLILHFVNPLL